MGADVATPCNEYKANIAKWRKCRDTVAGEEVIKERGRQYLPALDAQSADDYTAYKDRAMFYGASGRTVDGLLGALFRKTPTITPDTEKIKTELTSVTQDYQTAVDFSAFVGRELLVTGRLGILVDAPKEEGGTPYLTTYTAENIINWRFLNTGLGLKLSLVVLREKYETPKEEGSFVMESKTQYRVLELTVDGYYQQRVFRSKASGTEEGFEEDLDQLAIPKLSGKAFDYIPFIFVSPTDLTAEIVDSPILALCNVNISHYRSSADLEHGRHFTGLPTAWVAGFESGDALKIGSQIAWVSDNPDAHAGYLEFTGQGLGSLENALKEKQEMMAVLGARMLEDPKRMAESNAALSTRYRGENNVLSSISKTMSRALSKAFTWLLEWRGIHATVEVVINSDFINDRMTAEEAVKWMEAWQSGAISWDTLYYNYKRGEVYPDDSNKDVELAKLESEVGLDKNSFSGNPAV